MKPFIIVHLMFVCTAISFSSFYFRAYSQVRVTRNKSDAIVRNESSSQNAINKGSTSGQSSKYRICIDKATAVAPPPRKQREIFLIPDVDKNGRLKQPARLQQGLTSKTDKMWTPGDTITVGFYRMETTATYIDKVKLYAKHWESLANVKFSFVDDVNRAQIRVGFTDGSSWSYLGRGALDTSVKGRTMNFGWLNDETSEEDIRSVVLHEFGHALGFIHEHQSPASEIPWDKDKVYAHFGKAPNNWTRATVDHNIFTRYSAGETNFSSYDKHSIMHYYFPEELTSNKSVFYENKNLSPIDARFAGVFYPFKVNPTGTLRTGDDCDEIDFLIEYNVVQSHLVEFILQPGIDKKGNRVSWWKQVSIPMQGGVELSLQLNPDGKADSKTLPLIMINRGSTISFAKAKALGVHTNLGYKWDVLPAVLGGCRVTLTWRNDRCH